jgi:hypothetical protein
LLKGGKAAVRPRSTLALLQLQKIKQCLRADALETIEPRFAAHTLEALSCYLVIDWPALNRTSAAGSAF